MLNAGFKEEHVDGLWGAVGRGLRESIGAEPHKKIVEKLTTWSGATITQEQWKVYDTDGSTVLATITDAISYSGLFETSRTRTIA